MCERDRPETGCKLRSVFLLCAAALPWYTPHSGRTQPHRQPQRWLPAQYTTPTIGHPHRARAAALYHDSRTDPQGRAEALCYASGYHRGTQPHSEPQRWLPAQCTIERETASLSLYRGHRLRLYAMRARTQCTQGHRNGYSEPQPLPWYTHHRAQERHTEPHRWHVYFLRGSLYRLLRV